MSDKPVMKSELDLILTPILEKQGEQIEATKDTNKSLQDLALSIRDLASEKKHLEKEVETVKNDVSSIKKQFYSSWEWSLKLRDGVFKWIIPVVCGGILVSVLTMMGYVKAS